MRVCEIQMSFRKGCSNSVTSGCTCDSDSGLACPCLNYAEAKAVLDFHKAVPLIHPSSEEVMESRSKPTQVAQRRVRRLPSPHSCVLDVCGRDKRARKGTGVSELLWDRKGKPRRGRDVQHICITYTARKEQPE